MRREILVLLGVVFLMSFVVVAAETTKTGILVDAACAERMGGDEAKVAGHKVSCSLMPNCEASGFGVVVAGEFLKFDKAGDEKALMLLKNSEETYSFKVTVTGEVEGNNFAVKTITAASLGIYSY